MKLIYCVAFLSIIFMGFVTSKNTKGNNRVYIKSRFRCKSVAIRVSGNGPDSITASVYDALKKDTLKYRFKTSGKSNPSGLYHTLIADSKGSIIAGQIIDCSAKTIGRIIINGDNLPDVKYIEKF